MTALILGNQDYLKTFLVNNYDEIVIVDNSKYTHLLDYVTTHFVKKGSTTDPVSNHKGKVVYCDDKILSVSVHSHNETPQMSSEVPKTEYEFNLLNPSTEFIAMTHFLNLEYKVFLVGYPYNKTHEDRIEKRIIESLVLKGKVKIL